jgi:hypothetical protein
MEAHALRVRARDLRPSRSARRRGSYQAGVVGRASTRRRGRHPPPHDHVESVSADLGSALPVELRADSSFRLVRGRAAALTVVLEVQLDVDRNKRFTWPAYLANARLRDRCAAVVVVVTVDRRVARWARKSITLGPGSFMQPLVIGPDEVAPIVSVDAASSAPSSPPSHTRKTAMRRKLHVLRRPCSPSP